MGSLATGWARLDFRAFNPAIIDPRCRHEIRFVSSLVFSSRSDHGNAHFLRGVARTLARRGHAVVIFEAANRWCERAAVRDDGADAFAGVAAPVPGVTVRPCHLPMLDLDRVLDGADVVIAHASNDGDGAYDREFDRFLVQPVAALGLRARLHGVNSSRYEQLHGHAISLEGCLPDHRMPTALALARARAMIDIPHPSRRRALPRVPTTNMLEALACGMPLISAPWQDAEGLFHAGSHLTVANGEEATAAMMLLMDDRDLAADMAGIGLCSIQARHTCEHRVDELMTLLSWLTALSSPTAAKGRVPSQRPRDSRWIVAP
jgi:hypothetical protein